MYVPLIIIIIILIIITTKNPFLFGHTPKIALESKETYFTLGRIGPTYIAVYKNSLSGGEITNVRLIGMYL